MGHEILPTIQCTIYKKSLKMSNTFNIKFDPCPIFRSHLMTPVETRLQAETASKLVVLRVFTLISFLKINILNPKMEVDGR